MKHSITPSRGRLAACAIALAALAVAPAAQAHGHGGHGWHGGHARVGVFIGAPLGFYYGSPYWYRPYPYYYPPAVVAVPSSPPVYIEQNPMAQAPGATSQGYWYYCRNPEGYYPYVKECPGGWQQVAPQPAQ